VAKIFKFRTKGNDGNGDDGGDDGGDDDNAPPRCPKCGAALGTNQCKHCGRGYCNCDAVVAWHALDIHS